MTIPATAVVGQDFTVSYHVTNGGGNPADGMWYDSLYLSPTPGWSVNDPLLGQVQQSQNLSPGQSYTGTLTRPCQALRRDCTTWSFAPTFSTISRKRT